MKEMNSGIQNEYSNLEQKTRILGHLVNAAGKDQSLHATSSC